MDSSPEHLHAKLLRRRYLWRDLIRRTFQASTTDRLSLAAAGCAFYGTLALFPAISMLISVYGLMADPVAVEQQLSLVSAIIPAPAYGLIADRMHELISRPNGMLSAGLAVSLLLTLWSSSTGSKSVLSAINVAYDVPRQRPFLRFQAVGLAITVAAVLCAVLAIVVLVLLPVVFDDLGLMRHSSGLVHMSGMAMLIALFYGGACLLYRFGPHRERPATSWTWPGALMATVMWIVASELLSLYASRIATFGATYGSLGAVVAIMLWFYVSAYAVLLGAELNARLEEV